MHTRTPQYRQDQLEMLYLIGDLDQFPHIARRVEITWGDTACRKYLYGLTIDDSSRSHRQGFPLPILNTIVDLLDLHDVTFPQFIPTETCWDQLKS